MRQFILIFLTISTLTGCIGDCMHNFVYRGTVSANENLLRDSLVIRFGHLGDIIFKMQGKVLADSCILDDRGSFKVKGDFLTGCGSDENIFTALDSLPFQIVHKGSIIQTGKFCILDLNRHYTHTSDSSYFTTIDCPTITIQSGLDSLVAKQDAFGLQAFIKQWDIHFARDWKLTSANIKEIDHFKNGYVLTWTKTINNIEYSRDYVFDLDSKFISAHEQRFVTDTLLSQGEVNFEERQVKNIRQVIINKKSLKKVDSYWDYDVDGYHYEIYVNGILSCIYKTTNLNHYYMLFQKENKGKIELVTGPDCLGIKKN